MRGTTMAVLNSIFFLCAIVCIVRTYSVQSSVSMLIHTLQSVADVNSLLPIFRSLDSFQTINLLIFSSHLVDVCLTTILIDFASFPFFFLDSSVTQWGKRNVLIYVHPSNSMMNIIWCSTAHSIMEFSKSIVFPIFCACFTTTC